MGPVYDGENIVFYHKDFSNCTFWNETLQTGNWNKKVQENLTSSGDYKYHLKKMKEAKEDKSKKIPKDVDFWNNERARKNENMFSDGQKASEKR